MTSNDPILLNCPACGAPLDYDGIHPAVRCKFCGNISVVPAAVNARSGAPGFAFDEISQMANGDQLTAAIARYASFFGVDADEAKEAVNAIAAGRVVAPSVPGKHSPEELTQVMRQVQHLLESGNKLEAIKVYRQNFDVSLDKAKEALNQISSASMFQTDSTYVEPPPVPPANRGRKVGLLLAAMFSLIVIGVLMFLLFKGVASHYYPSQTDLLIPSTSAAGPQIAGDFYDANGDIYFVGLVDAGTRKLLWKTDALEKGSVTLVSGTDLIYTANGANLKAYHAADGSLAWQTEMKDSLSYGKSAMLVTAGRVIVDTADQSISAYDAESGELVWSRHLAYNDSTLRLMGNSLVEFDYPEGTFDEALFFIDPVSGSQQRSIAPTCNANDDTLNLSSDDGLLYDETSDRLVLVYADGCVQGIDLGTGEVAWTGTSQNRFDFSFDGLQSLLTKSALYFGSDNDLVAVDLAAGKTKVLINNADYSLLPLAQNGDTLIVRAKRTLGTTRFELWGVNITSGALSWQMNLPGAEPLDPPDEMAGLIDKTDLGWTWHMSSAGFVLLTFSGEPNRLTLETFNPADGTSLGKTTINLSRVSGDFYSIPSIFGSQGDSLYMNVDGNLCSVDLASGKLSVIY